MCVCDMVFCYLWICLNVRLWRITEKCLSQCSKQVTSSNSSFCPANVQTKKSEANKISKSSHFKSSDLWIFLIFVRNKLLEQIKTLCLLMCVLSCRCSYPLMFTNRSSAALWMWKTSSLNRQRQVELCRASFHRDSAAASLFSTAWHRMKPTESRERNRWLNKQAPTWI